MSVRHPAKYNDDFIEIFAKELNGCKNVIDIFAGTCKISKIKEYGYNGKIFCNELEPEWAEIGLGLVDSINIGDASDLPYKDKYFDAICTSPTYGNRMADHHNAKDGSRRNTYTHSIGRQLDEENTGKMQWGKKYREKHIEVFKESNRILKINGKFILNIKNHIRKGVEIDVSSWFKDAMQSFGFAIEKTIKVETSGNRFGANSNKRVQFEEIIVFKKISDI